jgi:hypothetical protein
MVDFRYHLVTIIAIFLALALGIVVGTTQLNGQVLDDLNGRISGLSSDKRDLERTIAQLRTRTESDEALVGSVAATVVAGKLTGERVVVITTPNAPDDLRSNLLPLLTAAGATLGTQVALRPDLVDPAMLPTVQQTVERAATSGLDRDGDAMTLAARELAAALLVPTGSATRGLTDEQATAILEAFGKSDLIDVEGELQPRGTIAVLLTGEAVVSADPEGVEARVNALLTVANELDRGGQGLVVSGPLSAVDDGGLIKSLRSLPLTEAVSSVDGVDKPQGRVATVLALREQRGGDSGQYGTGSDSDGPLPSGE